MPIALIRKLQCGAPLNDADRAAITAAVAVTRVIPAHHDLIREGERPNDVHVVMQGFAYRYKMLPDGSRQIVAWLLPGDFCDLHVAILGHMDHSIATLSESTIAYIPRASVEQLVASSPAIARAFWWATLVDESVLREWLVGLGRRSAEAGIAHLFCEIVARLGAVGLDGDGAVSLPMTQAELGDTVGISGVHVNRTLQALRRDGLIAWQGANLVVKDVAGLNAIAGFDPGYLHLVARAP